MSKILPINKAQTISIASACLAFSTWGLYPLFFKQLIRFSPAEVLAHRVIWSCIILAVGLIILPQTRAKLKAMRKPENIKTACLATVFISINWYCFIYAVSNDKILEGSLGYFLIPVVNSVLGMSFLGERPNTLKLIAILVSFSGIFIVFIIAGIVPVISLGIALSFGTYGLIRKRSTLNSALGLFLETVLLLPVAIIYLVTSGQGMFAHGNKDAGLLVLAGVMTLIPLLAMVAAAKRLEYGTLGFLQYITPIGHFLIAILVYHETISFEMTIAFMTTWLALVFYIIGSMDTSKSTKLPHKKELK